MFELENGQRQFFGLPPICDQWVRVTLPKFDGSVLYFDNDRLVRRVSNPGRGYEESQYDLPTQEGRETLLPVGKGKSQKLTPSTLSKRKPQGAHLTVDPILGVCISNETTQTTLMLAFGLDPDAGFVANRRADPNVPLQAFLDIKLSP